MKQLKSYFATSKREIVIATGAVIAMTGNFAMAAEGDIDISKGLLYIAGGAVAGGALVAAMIGLVTLIGAGKKAQRAGT